MGWQAKSSEVQTLLAAKRSLGEEVFFSGYSTDTRKIKAGDLFIALQGERFDGHDFIEQAVAGGAAGALVHRPLSEEQRERIATAQPNFVVLLVNDSLLALQTMATAWRQQCGYQVFAITGSNGKTTSKEFLTQILATKYKVHGAVGSLNNHWGVPFTLLDAGAEHQFVVVEMGMNSPGEIHRLCEIALPDVTAVSMVGSSHLGGLGSRDAIAKEKASIYAFSDTTRKVFNLDNPYTLKMWQEYGRSGDLCFSQNQSADIHMQVVGGDLFATELTGEILGHRFHASIPVYGKHNVNNLMLASAMACLAGMQPDDIVAAFAGLGTAWGRNQLFKAKTVDVLFDAYNANPESMKAFLHNLSDLPVQGNKHLLLGEMLELGEDAESLHYELGQQAATTQAYRIHFFGPNFEQFRAGLGSYENIKSSIFSNAYEDLLAKKIASMLQPGDAIFIKASRGLRLERFLELLDIPPK